MKIDFNRLNFDEFPFEIQRENLKFSGNLKKQNAKTVLCKAKIYGDITHSCDRCGKDILLNLDESVNLILSSGIYKSSQEALEDVMEFFDDEIDLIEVLQSEVEAYKSDYFYCDECKNL